MDENIGIKFTEPDVEMEGGMETPSKLRKRRLNKVYAHRNLLRVRETVRPDYIEVEHQAPDYKAVVSTPPNHWNPYRDYAYINSAGSGATIYWINWEFYISNPDLEDYRMAENRLMAEGVSQEWARPTRDHRGCMYRVGSVRKKKLVGRSEDFSVCLTISEDESGGLSG